MDKPIDGSYSDENNGCDFTFCRPIIPGFWWVRLKEVPELRNWPVLLEDAVITDETLLLNIHSPKWPKDIKTMKDTDGRVEWFLYPEQYVTKEMQENLEKSANDILNKL